MNKQELMTVLKALKAAGVSLPGAKVQKRSAKPNKPDATGLSARQQKNNAAAVRAFKAQGLTVTPRVDVRSYGEWVKVGKRVVPGQKGTFVKGCGTLFHSSQVQDDPTPKATDTVSAPATTLPVGIDFLASGENV